VADLQPAKLAAFEAHFKTESHAGLYLGGLPDVEQQKVRWGLAIPGGLSFLAFNDFDAEVTGLDQFPREDWPNVVTTHLCFQIMVGIGTLMAGIALLYFFFLHRPQFPEWLLRILCFSVPLGFIAIEAGWMVTELGRQPWIIYGFLKTKDALTPVPGMQYHFFLFLVLYLFLGFVTAWLLMRQIQIAQKKFEV
jgi:cytochrome d ubiquinol oxidase subunit I